MKGDFSRWDPVTGQNLSAVLHQQGRVLLDRDWNDQARLTLSWQDHAAREIIGADVAAVSTRHRHAFLVEAARVDGTDVLVELRPGPAWADGLAVELPPSPPDPTVERVATYLEPPIQAPPGDVASIAAGVRDAVVLEVWREALNGFQIPDALIEPALGGPDTTERALTGMRLRLFRLGAGETCHSIRDDLTDDPALQARLTATLQPAAAVAGDCPVAEGGGYVGFEHHLYRVEIADVAAGGAPMLKWSSFNGGLVGRGRWDRSDPANLAIDITANDQPIKTSGLDDFYMEVVEHDPAEGRWRVTYGADVTLNGSRLEVTNERYDRPVLPLPDRVFFRLWNEIRPVSDFAVPAPGVEPTPLRDGIRLELDLPAGGAYRPGDYWTFEVRAGDLPNPNPLVDEEAPQGPHLHRVALAELTWQDAGGEITFADEEIEDCREIFDPLTAPDGCCTFSVGDGVRSRGDFDSIEEALRHLPPEGGKLCVLPGRHEANVLIQGRAPLEDIARITIAGCGSRTVVQPRSATPDAPIFRIEAAQKITIESLSLVAATGTAIEVVDPPGSARSTAEIAIRDNDIVAGVHGIQVLVDEEVSANNDVQIVDNRIAMLDREEGRAGIFTLADHVLVERNRVVVVPAPADEPEDPRQPNDPTGPAFDPCADAQLVYQDDFRIQYFLDATIGYVLGIDGRFVGATGRTDYRAQGGIQIGGGSERVRVRDNLVVGGRGHGIVLGHLPEADGVEIERRPYYGTQTSGEAATFLQNRVRAVVYDVEIDRNAIHAMGLSGIGAFAFMDLETVGVLVRVEDLLVHRNRITHCALQVPEDVEMREVVGFGGISLADAERVTITDNLIERNGVSHIEPVCGIFVLMGERIDISDNHILDNGPRTGPTDATALAGMRGGVVIGMSFKSVAQDLLGAEMATNLRAPFVGTPSSPDGMPAVKLHDNVVVQPLGRALVVTALGPVSVVGNHLATQGSDFRVNSQSLIAAAVYIVNLGFSKDLFGLALLSGFGSLPQNSAGGSEAFFLNQRPTAGVAFLQRLLLLPSGSVLFANNRTTLDLRGREVTFGMSAQVIASLDDVSYSGNYSECTSLFDIVLTNAFLAGVTVRAGDNRFQEGVTLAFYSLMSFAVLNTAVANQSTHCLLVWGAAVRQALNLVLIGRGCSDEHGFFADELGYPSQGQMAIDLDGQWISGASP